jgi:hypothetical protein
MLWTSTVFISALFWLSVSFCLWWMTKLRNLPATSLVWSSANPIPNPWNVSCGYWRTFFKPDSGIWMAFMFQDLSSVGWRWHSGWPSTRKMTENIDNIQELVHYGRHQIMHESRHHWNQLQSSLDVNRESTKLVPWLLTKDQKQHNINMCLELREKANKDPIFISISLHLQNSNPKQIMSSRKLLPCCFWSMEKMMRLLYTFPRRLLWWRWPLKVSK